MRRAFHHWGMVPRIDGRLFRTRSVGRTVRNATYPRRCFMAPIGLNGEASQDRHGDMGGRARLGADRGAVLRLDGWRDDPLEDVRRLRRYARVVPALLRRGPRLGTSLTAARGWGISPTAPALVVTLDTWVTGWRPRDINASNFPATARQVAAELLHRSRFPVPCLPSRPKEDPAAAIFTWAADFRAGAHVGRHGMVQVRHEAAGFPEGHRRQRPMRAPGCT